MSWYYHAKRNSQLIDIQKLRENVDKLRRFCGDEKNFRTPVMKAIDQLFGNED
jgi:hypothetical protein